MGVIRMIRKETQALRIRGSQDSKCERLACKGKRGEKRTDATTQSRDEASLQRLLNHRAQWCNRVT